MKQPLTVLVCGVLAIGGAGCGSSSSGSTTAPTVTRTTETFNGTVAVRGSAFNTFTVATTGTTEATLTAAGPPSTIVVGFSIGTASNGACTPIAGADITTPAGTAPQLSGVTSSGSLCVQVRDIGNQTAPITYTVSVTHP